MKQSTKECRGFTVTTEKIVKFTRTTVYLTCIWSPLPSAKQQYIICYNIFLYVSIFLAFALLFSLIASVVKFVHDAFIVLKSVILIIGICNYLFKVIAVTIHQKTLQRFELSFGEFLKTASDIEREHLQLNVNKCWKFQAFMTSSYYLTTAGVLIGPLILPQKFPTDAVYPFPVEHPIVKCLVYLHQCIVGFQCSAGMALDCQIALFLWYLGARYEVLARKSRNVINTEDIRNFVKYHQNLLDYAKEITNPIKAITFITVVMSRIGMILGALMLVSDQPVIAKVQFLIVVISTTANIFVCVRAADYLITVSSRLLSEKIFETCCYQSPRLRNEWRFIILRSQKPIVIKITGVFDSLSYEFYSTFLSTAFSYFTALRVIVNT
ncbi:uncharacterized protein [Chelonus insularis]|uniref:uncharacterized protein n=1 Tax=Chelonus insularis TaxID=460826 RepID=UPI00158C354E|nr:uncharacterized protein LOC118069123 [Chelonus insularis]